MPTKEELLDQRLKRVREEAKHRYDYLSSNLSKDPKLALELPKYQGMRMTLIELQAELTEATAAIKTATNEAQKEDALIIATNQARVLATTRNNRINAAKLKLCNSQWARLQQNYARLPDRIGIDYDEMKLWYDREKVKLEIIFQEWGVQPGALALPQEVPQLIPVPAGHIIPIDALDVIDRKIKEQEDLVFSESSKKAWDELKSAASLASAAASAAAPASAVVSASAAAPASAIVSASAAAPASAVVPVSAAAPASAVVPVSAAVAARAPASSHGFFSGDNNFGLSTDDMQNKKKDEEPTSTKKPDIS